MHCRPIWCNISEALLDEQKVAFTTSADGTVRSRPDDILPYLSRGFHVGTSFNMVVERVCDMLLRVYGLLPFTESCTVAYFDCSFFARLSILEPSCNPRSSVL